MSVRFLTPVELLVSPCGMSSPCQFACDILFAASRPTAPFAAAAATSDAPKKKRRPKAIASETPEAPRSAQVLTRATVEQSMNPARMFMRLNFWYFALKMLCLL